MRVSHRNSLTFCRRMAAFRALHQPGSETCEPPSDERSVAAPPVSSAKTEEREVVSGGAEFLLELVGESALNALAAVGGGVVAGPALVRNLRNTAAALKTRERHRSEMVADVVQGVGAVAAALGASAAGISTVGELTGRLGVAADVATQVMTPLGLVAGGVETAVGLRDSFRDRHQGMRVVGQGLLRTTAGVAIMVGAATASPAGAGVAALALTGRFALRHLERRRQAQVVAEQPEFHSRYL